MRPLKGIPTDYSKKEFWLSLPDRTDKPADVIFLYPSSCFDRKAGAICAVDNRSMVWGARRNFAQQATVFQPFANLFAPFWRQVNAVKLSEMSFEEVNQAEWNEPRTDVYAALDYYFENLNQGRPFFLAGHSQGSRLCYIALSEYFKEHPDYYANMIAAYCLGDSLTKQYLEENPHVKAAQSAYDLGVVVSWNTEGPGNKGHKTLVVAPGAVCVNPLNWKTDDTYASAELNLGSYRPYLLFPRLHKLRVKADAVINPERGTVVVTDPRLKKFAITAIPGFRKLEPVFGPESYHGCDYSFFYQNIRKNARARMKAWYVVPD